MIETGVELNAGGPVVKGTIASTWRAFNGLTRGTGKRNLKIEFKASGPCQWSLG